MTEETFRVVVSIGVALAAVSAVLAAVVALILAAELRKIQARVQVLIDRAEPVLDSARKMLDDTAPKFAAITADAVQVLHVSREQTERIGELIKDVSERAKVQVARIDGTIDQSLEQLQVASGAVKDAVLRPVREFNGIFTGIKTAVSVYATGRRASVDHATQDEEMFI
jgi:ElaB/YqjD/DUF883 family membrane-anchored ribosome-binding protein